ncbi:MAG: ADP-forming succinate--CoA ligase subunit beta [Kiritimatiellae bacterium]|nr:ADP-forming succinate--CoA ligase subunit beta [Kiritimatiellia bacterium]
MKIHEYQAKDLFRSYGMLLPSGKVARSADEAESISNELGSTVAVKSQVHVGGRGKAGGIKLAHSPEEARAAAEAILGMDIKGSIVRKVWVEQAARISKEAYLGLIVDRSSACLSFICSSEGGVEIEETAAKTPEKILRFKTYPKEFPEDGARKYAGQLFGDETSVDGVLDVMRKLFKLFAQKDCSLAEINPLVLTEDGQVIALDGKINFDDNALYRHPEIEELRDMDEENENEITAKEQGLSFVQLDGDIGCMVNGAGLAMATMDAIKLFGGDPANFLDVGGSSNPEKVVNAFRLILNSSKVKAILINIFGGITRCDDIARGIIESGRQIDINVPIVVRLVGTNMEEGLGLLKGTSLIPASTLADGVQKTIDLAKGTISG